MAITRLGYPCAPGNKNWSSYDLTGPSSYTTVSTGSPLGSTSGGQQISASVFGLTTVEGVWCESGDNTGTYGARCYLAPFQKAGGSPTVIVQWVVAATGAEVTGTTNLSASTLRLRAIGS
jgi:hypothetical protein